MHLATKRVLSLTFTPYLEFDRDGAVGIKPEFSKPAVFTCPEVSRKGQGLTNETGLDTIPRNYEHLKGPITRTFQRQNASQTRLSGCTGFGDSMVDFGIWVMAL